jgi:hypothetical protein
LHRARLGEKHLRSKPATTGRGLLLTGVTMPKFDGVYQDTKGRWYFKVWLGRAAPRGVVDFEVILGVSRRG